MINPIAYHNNRLFYHKEGDGKKVMILFHGFGQNHQAFAGWYEVLKNEYTLYSFDLFFHGESQWTDRAPLKKKDWKNMLQLFFEKEKIEKIEMAGFSLGGKFALATLEAFPEKVKRIVLLAPDGIKTNFWYRFATYPIVTRALFKSMILHPNRLNQITKILGSISLVDRSLLRFAESQMDTAEKRKRVYLSWVFFRHLKFDLHHLARLVNDYRISFIMILGKYDKVIVAKDMNRLLNKLHDYHLEVLETGHNGVMEEGKAFLI